MRCLTVGDSIAGLVGSNIGFGLANKGHINCVVANPGSALVNGVNGNNVNGYDWQARINEYIGDFAPDFFVVILGTNDAGRHIPNPTYQNGMKSFMDKLGGKPVYWCNVADKPWNTFWLPYGAADQNWALDDLVARNVYPNLKRIDVKSAMTQQSWFLPDGLHPNATGANVYAATILNQMP